MANETIKQPNIQAISAQISPDGQIISAPVVQAPAPPPTIVEPVAQPAEPLAITEPKPVEPIKPDEEPTIDFSEFLTAKDVVTAPDPKPAKVEPTDTKPVAPKKSELPAQRDYSDIPAEDKPIFEQMSNDAFAKLKPIYLKQQKESKEIETRDAEITELKKGRVPESYYEHPNAVVLTPEFEQASTGVNYAQQIAQHWEDQFDKVKAGESTYKTIHLNDKGQLYLSEPVQVDKTSETKLLKYVTWAQGQVNQKQSELNTLVTQHRTRSAELANWPKEYEKKAFALFDGPEATTLKAIVNDTIKHFPKVYHSNPLIGMVAKSMVLNMLLGNKLKAASNGATTAQPATTTTKSNGNLSAAEIAGDAGGKVTNVKFGESIDDFEKYKQGLQ